MNWTCYLFSFEGRINRAKIWLAALVWFAAIYSFMTIFNWVMLGILLASGNHSHSVSSWTMPPVFYLARSPLLIIFVWLLAAITIKRLHDRGKSGWWIALFLIAPRPLDRLSDWLDYGPLAALVSALDIGLSVWCFVELFCLRGKKGPNRFGPDPRAPIPATPLPSARWDQQSELEFVPHSAGPSAGPHVKRGHD
jgi:uncharacterized membrane protein YhaH (DUF805 family)